MEFKKIDQIIGFAELALSTSMQKNRSLTTLKQTNKVVDWVKIENIMWFRILSDSELESQINDRISFKSFLKLPFDMPSPDHSTFSRFRKRLPYKHAR